MLGNIPSRLGGVSVFGIPISAYNVASSRRCLGVADDKIDNVLEIFVGVTGCLFLPVVTLDVVLFAVSLHRIAGGRSRTHLIYSGGVFSYALPDTNNLGSNSYNSVGTQLTGTKFRVTFSG